jgi:hypothetical protein
LYPRAKHTKKFGNVPETQAIPSIKGIEHK